MTTPLAVPTSTIIASHRSNKMMLVVLILNVLCITCAELFLTTGAKGSQDTSLFALAALQRPETIAGIFFYISAFGLWMYALKSVPLSLAYNFTAINQVLIPIAAWVFLKGEQISPLRWVGISMVFVGFLFLVPILARVEADPAPSAPLPPAEGAP